MIHGPRPPDIPIDTPIHLSSGTVHRVVVDLVQISLWVQQQENSTPDPHRRRQLHTTHLACRLTAEVVNETLCTPALIAEPPLHPARTTSSASPCTLADSSLPPVPPLPPSSSPTQ